MTESSKVHVNDDNCLSIKRAPCYSSDSSSSAHFDFETNNPSYLSEKQLSGGVPLKLYTDEAVRTFIRPSYFLRAVQESNFYHTVLRNYHMAQTIFCNKLAYFESNYQSGTAESSLSGQWARISPEDLFVVTTNELPLMFDLIQVSVGFLVHFNSVRKP